MKNYLISMLGIAFSSGVLFYHIGASTSQPSEPVVKYSTFLTTLEIVYENGYKQGNIYEKTNPMMPLDSVNKHMSDTRKEVLNLYRQLDHK